MNLRTILAKRSQEQRTNSAQTNRNTIPKMVDIKDTKINAINPATNIQPKEEKIVIAPIVNDTISNQNTQIAKASPSTNLANSAVLEPQATSPSKAIANDVLNKLNSMSLNSNNTVSSPNVSAVAPNNMSTNHTNNTSNNPTMAAESNISPIQNVPNNNIEPIHNMNANQNNMQPMQNMFINQNNIQPLQNINANQNNMQPLQNMNANQNNMQPVQNMNANQNNMQPVQSINATQNNMQPLNNITPNTNVFAKTPIMNPIKIERDELLRQLTAFDFMAVDLQLYLDTHPNDKLALEKYNSIILQAEELRYMYQSQYGPLYSFRSPSLYPWQWTQGQWPWSKEFNYSLAGEDK